MKKRLAKFLSLVMILTSLVPITVFGASDNRVSRVLNLMEMETMLSDSWDISHLVPVKDYTKGIKYILPASELVLVLEDDLPKDSQISITLDNAKWFFRSTDPSINAIEYYTGGVEKTLPTNFNTNNGTYKPDGEKSLGGVYTRSGVSGEVNYALIIGEIDGQNATLITSSDGKAGDEIVVPLITRILEYDHAYVSVESNTTISNSTHKFVDAEDFDSEKPYVNNTKTYVKNPVDDIYTFPVDKLIIDEEDTAIIKNGVFEIIAPKGIKILPDVEDSLIDLKDKKLLEIEDKSENIINISTNDKLKWKKRDESGLGEMGKDYTIKYGNTSNGGIDHSHIIIELLDISPSIKKDLGRLTITGLKLEADLDFKPGDIKLEIKNKRDIKLTEEKFVAGTKKEDTNGKDDTKIYPDLDHYPLDTLINLKEFKAKPYIVAVNNKVEPDKKVTRGEVASMFYNLFANKDTVYESKFTDVSPNYSQAVNFSSTKGFISGYPDGSFKEDKTITRGEMATILTLILELDEDISGVQVLAEEKNHWAYNSLAQMVNKKIMSGYPDGSLKPDNDITKAEAVTMINIAFNRGSYPIKLESNYTDLSESHWGYLYLLDALLGN